MRGSGSGYLLFVGDNDEQVDVAQLVGGIAPQ
jgi:hypothetical protein